jgi:membrane-bound lytic murein transglycosylase D
MRKLLIIALSVMAGEFSIAQESQEKELPLFAPKVSYLDSLKSTFVNHSTSSCIDERWMNELANSQLSKEMFYDIEHLNIDEKVNYDFDTELFKNRLKKLDARSPFVIEYNPTLENTIKAFLKNRSKSIERQMALAEYYFPMFEEHLAKYNLPLEIKYLAIVESALNPRAKSRVGAGGIWQFMPATGKQYKLNISSYVDERHDPLKATEAMCQYMTNMYAIFGDWSLVLASYNCGPGNVSKAIRRAGGSTDYWEIRRYLPQETANYVPAFLATMYIYEFKKEYGLKPRKANVTYFETDTVAVRKALTFKQIAELLDVTVEELEFFNPTYSKNHIPSYEDELYFLRLPKHKIGLFVSNEEKIYAYVDYLEAEKIRKSQLAKLQKRDSIAKKDSVAIALADVSDIEYEKVVEKHTKEVVKKDYHKVKKGETLSEIADKYNVSIAELRKWNKVKGSNINLGQSLVIQTKKKVTVNEIVKKPVKKTDVKTIDEDTLVADNTSEKAQEKGTNTKEVVPTTASKKDRIEIKEDFYIVQKGDSIFSITKKFPNLTVEDLKKKNNLPNNNIQPGMKLKIQG